MSYFGKKKANAIEDRISTVYNGRFFEKDIFRKDTLTKQEIEEIPTELFCEAEFDESAAEHSGYSGYSYWRSTVHMFLKNKLAVFLLCTLLIIVLFTFIQPLLPGQRDPNTINNDPETGMFLRNVQPGSEFWLGTNDTGQDMWARVWAATRNSLIIGFTVAVADAFLGIVLGLVWGYIRSLDVIFTEFYNICSNIPQTIILILISYIMRPSMSTMIIAMAATGWIAIARFVRNQVIVIRDRDFNLASRCLGTPTRRIIVKNLLPQMVSVVMLRMALAIPAAIGNEVFLTYIGLGLPIDSPSLGNMINEGRLVIRSELLRYQLIIPAVAISMITVSFYLVGNAFADAADPRNHV